MSSVPFVYFVDFDLLHLIDQREGVLLRLEEPIALDQPEGLFAAAGVDAFVVVDLKGLFGVVLSFAEEDLELDFLIQKGEDFVVDVLLLEFVLFAVGGLFLVDVVLVPSVFLGFEGGIPGVVLFGEKFLVHV